MVVHDVIHKADLRGCCRPIVRIFHIAAVKNFYGAAVKTFIELSLNTFKTC